MKTEQTGTASTPLSVFEPGCVPAEMMQRIEDFKVPADEYTNEKRNSELAIERSYYGNCLNIVTFSPFDHSTIVGLARIFMKRDTTEKLPIEFSTVESITGPESPANNWLTIGKRFDLSNRHGPLPICEIGCLKVAPIDSATGITLTTHSQIVKTLIYECDKQAHERSFNTFFLTCVGSLRLQRIYTRRCFFNEIGTVSYPGSEQRFKALWRYPGRRMGA